MNAQWTRYIFSEVVLHFGIFLLRLVDPTLSGPPWDEPHGYGYEGGFSRLIIYIIHHFHFGNPSSLRVMLFLVVNISHHGG